MFIDLLKNGKLYLPSKHKQSEMVSAQETKSLVL